MGEAIPASEVPILVFFDCETTGLECLKQVGTPYTGSLVVPWHEIIEIGWVKVRQRDDARGSDWAVLEEMNIRVVPQHLVIAQKKALAVNGYLERKARGEWADAISLRDALRLFLESCEKAVFVGVNPCFDSKFLEVAFARAGIRYAEFQNRFHYRVLDVSAVAWGRFASVGAPYLPRNFGSSMLAEFLGIEGEQKPHEALRGAQQAYALYRALMELDAKKLRLMQKRVQKFVQ